MSKVTNNCSIPKNIFLKFVLSLCHNGPYHLNDFAACYPNPELVAVDSNNRYFHYVEAHYMTATASGLSNQQLHDLAKRLQSKIIESMRYNSVLVELIPLEGHSQGWPFAITREQFIGFTLEAKNLTLSQYILTQTPSQIAEEDQGYYWYADFHYEASLSRQDSPETIVDLAYYIRTQIHQARACGQQLNTYLTLVPPLLR